MSGRRGKTRLRRQAVRAPYEPTAIQMEIYAKVCKGTKTHREIGAEHNITHNRVSQIVKRIEEYLVPHWAENVRLIKVGHAERLMHIFAEAMQAWERSKRPAITITVKEVPQSDGNPLGVEKTRKVQPQAGNPAFLAEARAALNEIRAIWGANAPAKIEHSGELRVAGVSIEEANRQLAERIEEARQRLIAPTTN